jgi:hypothetical protein
MVRINYPNKQEYAELLSQMLDQYFKKQKEFYQQNSIEDPNFIFYVGMKEWYAIRLIDQNTLYPPTIEMNGDMQWLGSPVIRINKESYFHMALKDRV